MNSRPFRLSYCFPGLIDIFPDRSGKGGYYRALYLLRNRSDRLEIFRRRTWETAFNDIHSQFCELLGNFDLLSFIEFRSGDLFAVPESSVENMNFSAHLLLLG